VRFAYPGYAGFPMRTVNAACMIEAEAQQQTTPNVQRKL